ncbi:hypothetical protein ACPPVO_36450 [Dactylosporangium sp. McL0621]
MQAELETAADRAERLGGPVAGRYSGQALPKFRVRGQVERYRLDRLNAHR